MKKFGIFLIFFILVGGFCFAQSNNDSQRIVGTWVSSGGQTYIFNSDGTFTGNSSGNYFLSGTKLVWIERDGFYASSINYFLSPNGRILVLDLDEDNLMYWFVKQ
jgi:hypothetical protein